MAMSLDEDRQATPNPMIDFVWVGSRFVGFPDLFQLTFSLDVCLLFSDDHSKWLHASEYVISLNE